MTAQKALTVIQPAVRTVGLDELGLSVLQLEHTKLTMEKLARRLCKGKECGVTVHCKAYDHEGQRKKFSVHVRYVAPGILLVSGKMHDWKLETALRAAFRTLDDRLKALHEQHRLVFTPQRKGRKKDRTTWSA